MEPSQSDLKPSYARSLKDEHQMTKNLYKILRNFTEGQLELHAMNQFIRKNQKTMNDRQSEATSAIQLMYPHLDHDYVDQAVNAANPFFTFLAKPSPPETELGQAQELRNKEAGKILNKMFKDIQLVVPDGYAAGCCESIIKSTASAGRSLKLRASLLISLVAEFEVLLVGIFNEIHSWNPNQAIKKSSFDWKYIADHESLEELKNRIIEDSVMNVMYGNYTNWLESLAAFRIEVPDYCRDAEIKEIFQRRHIMVHNDGIISRAYMNRTESNTDLKVGDRLRVDSSYFEKAADKLAAVGVMLVCSVATKILQDENHVEHILALAENESYTFLRYKRYQAIIDIHEGLTAQYARNVSNVNYWLALKAVGKFNQCENDVRRWAPDNEDPTYELAKHALLDELEAGSALMAKLVDGGQLSISNAVTWPLLSNIRDYDRKRGKFA